MPRHGATSCHVTDTSTPRNCEGRSGCTLHRAVTRRGMVVSSLPSLSLLRVSHATSLPRHYHVTTTSLPRHCHVTTTSLPRHCHVTHPPPPLIEERRRRTLSPLPPLMWGEPRCGAGCSLQFERVRHQRDPKELLVEVHFLACAHKLLERDTELDAGRASVCTL